MREEVDERMAVVQVHIVQVKGEVDRAVCRTEAKRDSLLISAIDEKEIVAAHVMAIVSHLPVVVKDDRLPAGFARCSQGSSRQVKPSAARVARGIRPVRNILPP